jgi:hypothetical protein
MTGLEDKVPVERRYLVLDGIVSNRSLELIKSGLPQQHPPNALVLFVEYAYADVPLGRSFQVVFPYGNAELGIRAECRIVAVTQQFGRPFDLVPQGWKTICIIEFPKGTPDLIQQLPIIDNWFEFRDRVCISSGKTWHALLKRE